MKHHCGTLLVCLLTVVALAPRRVDAHVPRDLVGTQVKLRFFEDRIEIILDLGYRDNWAQSEMIRMDADRDSEVAQDEADAYSRVVWSKKILRENEETGETNAALTCKIDGKPVQLVLKSIKHDQLVGRVFPSPFTIYYTCVVRPPDGPFRPDEMHEIEVLDVVTRDEAPTKPDYLLPFSGHSNDPKRFRLNPTFVEPPTEKVLTLGFDAMWFAQGTEKLIVQFEFSERLERLPDVPDDVETSSGTNDDGSTGGEVPIESVPRGAASEASSDAASAPAGPEKPVDPDAARDLEESSWFANALDDMADGASFWTNLLYLLMAIAWGAGHAFTPGHGKTMVAAYLIGTKGRFRDAVILGLTTTFTHTVVVYTVGIVVLVIAHHYAGSSEGALANRAIVICMVVSGTFLCLMGLTIFYRRVRGIQGGHSHGHDHEGGHSHGHAHEGSPSHGLALEPVDTHREEKADRHEHGHGHEHEHEHEHEHAHDHAHEPKHEPKHEHAHEHKHTHETAVQPTLKELLALGFSGGLLPCPAGITVILIGLHRPDELLFAILLIIFFSIGLGGVLVMIGVLLISGKMIASRRGLTEGAFFQQIGFLQKIFAQSLLAKLDVLGVRLLRVMPAASCLFIAMLGAFFVVTSIVGHPTEVRAILDSIGL
jgi:ABC-type nickel/cobalt efflux system permease component RcnA